MATYDLAVVKYISDQIMVMYLGQMVEFTSADELFQNQLHPYTKALLSAVPSPDIDHKRNRILLKGEIKSPIDPGPGCRFASRCQYASEKCFKDNPDVVEYKTGHFVRCHYVDKINEKNV